MNLESNNLTKCIPCPEPAMVPWCPQSHTRTPHPTDGEVTPSVLLVSARAQPTHLFSEHENLTTRLLTQALCMVFPPANAPPMWLTPKSCCQIPSRGELTLGVSADESGEVSKECERGEVGQVGNLQGVQQGAQAFSTEPERQRGQEREAATGPTLTMFPWAPGHCVKLPHTVEDPQSYHSRLEHSTYSAQAHCSHAISC